MPHNCPCQSQTPYDDCCGRFISGAQVPLTAEQLMRARYTAFAKGEIDFIKRTRHPESTNTFYTKDITEWSTKSTWHGFELLKANGGSETDDGGTIEFIAHYTAPNGKKERHHEVAIFQKHETQWYFVDGDPITAQPVRRDTPKTGRNDPCPCGSGKKYKKCCS